MRTRNVRLGLVLGAFVLLASAPAALATAADTTTVVQRQVDVNPGETNPCTGAIGTIVNDEQDVFHITALGDGPLRLSGHSTATVTFVPTIPTASATRDTRRSRSPRTAREAPSRRR